jgi:hypothetical protein
VTHPVLTPRNGTCSLELEKILVIRFHSQDAHFCDVIVDAVLHLQTFSLDLVSRSVLLSMDAHLYL